MFQETCRKIINDVGPSIELKLYYSIHESVGKKERIFFSGTLSVEEVYKDRDQFAALVREVAAPDVGRMGIEILSFTIKDVYDEVQYLTSLGKAQTAAVKRDADVGVAEANRDAGIRVCLGRCLVPAPSENDKFPK